MRTVCAIPKKSRSVTSPVKIAMIVPKRVVTIRKNANRTAAQNAVKPRIRIFISLRRKKTAVVPAMIKRSTATIAVPRKAKIPRRRRNAAVLLLNLSACAIPPQRDVAESSAFETRAVVVATVKTTKHAKSDVDPSVAASLATKPNKVMPSRRPTNGFATLLILFRVSELRRQ